MALVDPPQSAAWVARGVTDGGEARTAEVGTSTLVAGNRSDEGGRGLEHSASDIASREYLAR